MTREQRRAHYREAKKDPVAVYCPRCTHKTRHVAMPLNTFSKRDYENGEKCQVVCVACGNILRTGINLIPYTYVGPEVVAKL